jgi:hypothetical protein
MAVDLQLYANLALVSAGSVTYEAFLAMDDNEAVKILKAFNKVIKDAQDKQKEERALDERAAFYKNGR